MRNKKKVCVIRLLDIKNNICMIIFVSVELYYYTKYSHELNLNISYGRQERIFSLILIKKNIILTNELQERV